MTKCRRSQTWETTSAQGTFALGESLGHSLVGGLTIGLAGPLGAGKTQLVKGIAAGNAVDDVRRVTSPTFTLIHEYPGRLSLYHVDVYRLRDTRELWEIGFDELARADAVVVVEWADRLRSAIPDEALWIALIVTGDSTRRLMFDASGDLARRCLEAVRESHR